MSLINEAFKELKDIQGLDEELFSFDKKGVTALDAFLDRSSEPVLDVIDPLASDEEELQPDYTGNVICRCCVCKQLIYKKPEDVVIDEETQRVNVDEECPHCCNVGGFEVVGQVEPYVDKSEVKVTVDDDEVEVEDTEEESEEETVTESLNEERPIRTTRSKSNAPYYHAIKRALGVGDKTANSILKLYITYAPSAFEEYPDPEEFEEFVKDDVFDLLDWAEDYRVPGIDEIRTAIEFRESLNEARTDDEIIDDYIGLRGKFRGYTVDEAKQLYDTWDDKLKRPTAPEEIEDYEELRDTYGKTVEIISCSIFIKGNSPIDTFDKSYWEVEFNDGTEMSGVGGYNIDLYDFFNGRLNIDKPLYEDTVKTKKGWVNKGKAGTHGTFKTKKAADAQRRAMFASGYKGESLEEDLDEPDIAIEEDDYTLDEKTGNISVDKQVFDDFVKDSYIRIHFTDDNDDDSYIEYKMIDETEDAIIMEYLGGPYGQMDESMDTNLTIEVTEDDINFFDEETGDIIVDKTKFIDKEIKEGDYITIKFVDETEDTDTQDYKFIRETNDGFQLEWIGTKELHEDFQKATVETGESILSMESDDSGKVTVTSEPRKIEESGDEMIVPVSNGTKTEIEINNSEEEVTDETEETSEETATEEEVVEEEPTSEEETAEEETSSEVEVDEFEESYFSTLGKKYLQEVYNNVDDFITTKGAIDGNKIKLEGIITFNSGKKVKTNFVFEGKEITKKGKVRFLGENTQITAKKNAFTLSGTIKQGKLFVESLNYNYRAKDAVTGKVVREYGTVKR